MKIFLNAAASLALAFASTLAGATTYAGNLGDAGNAALVASDLTAALFDNDNDIANNVALYTFTTYAGTVTIVSTGFAAGGVDPYFTLFSGSGATASFYDSNYTQAFDTGGDFTWTGTLAAGTYEIALGSFANMSFAEQYPPGTYLLGDGFSLLGDPNALHDGSYSLTLSTVVPEPSSTWLLAIGLGALVATRARRDRQA